MPYYIVGVDEVGRGPVAGPVTVCAVAIKRNLQLITYDKSTYSRQATSNKQQITSNKSLGFFHGKQLKLRDSKKLSQKRREEWMAWAQMMKKKGEITYVVSSVSPRVIDRINISRAANLAATRALTRLCKKNSRVKRSNAFLDGGLYPLRNKLITYNLKLKTITRGDELIPVISLASIIAKVTRDRRMTRFAKKYPEYLFEKNKGYGTLAHRKAIRKNGISEIHRLTFLKNWIRIKK